MSDGRRDGDHWSDVLTEVADLGARVDTAKQTSLAQAAEASDVGGDMTGLTGPIVAFPAIKIGPPPPRQARVPRGTAARLRAEQRAREEAEAAAAARAAATEVAPGIQIGAPPPRASRADAPLAPTAAPAAPAAPEVAAPDGAPAAEGPSVGRTLLKDNLVVAAGTALSRVTGVGRLLAVYLLSLQLADAYLLANNTPNIIYELILGGVLTATLVPLFTQYLEERDDDATSAVVSTTIVALGGLTILAFGVAPLLMLLYGSNVDGPDADQFRRVGIYLSLLFVPQIFFYGCMALGSALLNARKRFFAAAWAPVLNNLVVIAVIFGTARLAGSGALDLDDVDGDVTLLALLGLGTTAGIAVMALSLLPALRRARVKIRFRPSLRHPAVRRAAGLSGWTLGYVIANQVSAQTVNVLAVGEPGVVRSYQVGFIFFQLPHGLLAVSLMTTFQPDLARAYVQKAWDAFHVRLLQGLRLLVVVMVPAAVGYFTLASVVVAIGEESSPLRGSDGGPNQLVQVAEGLAGFAPGLIGFSIYLFLLRGFYAVQDTKRPFWINCVENVANIALAFLLIVPFSLIGGLTVAYSLAYLGAAALALVMLVRRLPPGFDTRGFLSSLLRCLVAGAAMAVVVGVLVLGLSSVSPDLILVWLVLAVPVGGAVYIAAALLLGVVREAGLAGRLPGPLARMAR